MRELPDIEFAKSRKYPLYRFVYLNCKTMLNVVGSQTIFLNIIVIFHKLHLLRCLVLIAATLVILLPLNALTSRF